MKETIPRHILSFLRYCKRYCKLIYFGWFGYAWLWSPKRMVSACKNLHAKNQTDPSRLSWNTANILQTCFFWVLLTYLATLTKKQEILILHAKNQLHSFLLLRHIAKILQPCYFGYFRHAWLNSLQKTLMFIFMQKNKFIPHLILMILLRYYKLIILGTLGMPGYGHQTGWYQLVVNFNACLDA